MLDQTPSFTYVSVPVPEHHVPKVIELLADLHREESTEPKPDQKIYLDANVVMRMYLDSEKRHRTLLEFMAENPGVWLYTSDLETALGVTTGSRGMAGTFGAFGRRSKHRYGGAKPWELGWDQARNEARYRMNPEVAEWIKAAAHGES
jgi:hypothetical protein